MLFNVSNGQDSLSFSNVFLCLLILYGAVRLAIDTMKSLRWAIDTMRWLRLLCMRMEQKSEKVLPQELEKVKVKDIADFKA